MAAATETSIAAGELDDRPADEAAVIPDSGWWDRAKVPPRPRRCIDGLEAVVKFCTACENTENSSPVSETTEKRASFRCSVSSCRDSALCPRSPWLFATGC